ncbi:amidohydrolase family protein [Nocardia sp. NPDC051052]|uniref:amidohydrolase family protein n=1 Tax=Nocardia sp. NPDC051052 TaxID=3364322 RepID=UPI003787FB0C
MRVFDGTVVLPRASVLIGPTHITSITPECPVPPPGTEVIEGSRRTLLPGLIDGHAHVFPGATREAMRFGVTTVLDMFAEPAVASSLRAHARVDATIADLRTAGIGATAPAGHPWSLVQRGLYRPFPVLHSADRAAEFVAERIAEGSDYIKVFVEDGTTVGRPVPCLSRSCVAAVIAAAHEHGRLAIAHATTYAAARLAIAEGADALGHVIVDQPIADGFADSLAKSGVFVIPTLTALAAVCAARSGALSLHTALENTEKLYGAGVRILAGTDAPNPGAAHGGGLHRELELLVAAGLSATDALAAATRTTADCFGLSDRGRIVVGVPADLVLVDGDPTTSITATTSIAAIWRRGLRLPR